MRNPPSIPSNSAEVDAAIISRRSVRAFRCEPVPRETIADILRVASRSPSGANTQPWRVWVLTGGARTELCAKIRRVDDDPDAAAAHREEYDYYPTRWEPPYLERRRKVGWDLYGLLGIGRADKERMHMQQGRNYEFFGAPVGLFFTIDRSLGRGSWLDYGMFLQSVMIAARARGLDTCPQASFNKYHRIVMEHLRAPVEQMLVCGMALGHADAGAVENALRTEREPVEVFARFVE